MRADVPAVRSTHQRKAIPIDLVAALFVVGTIIGVLLGQLEVFHKAEPRQSSPAMTISPAPSPEGMALFGPNIPSADGRQRDGDYRPPMYPGMLYTCRVPRQITRPELYLPKPMHVIKGMGGEFTDLGWQAEYMMVAPSAIYKLYTADQPPQLVLFRLVCEDRDDTKWEFQPID